MSDNSRVSKALYVGLCGYIGTPTEVTFRREVVDMEEMIQKPRLIHEGRREMVSGSNREGFRFKSSDIDTMFWFTNYKMITDLSQSSVYDLSKHSIILMEDTDTPPGFVRLQLLTSPGDRIIASSVVQYNDGMYVSNIKWMQLALTAAKNIYSNTKQHGPCANGFSGDIEADQAVCFHSSYWSRLTCHWRKRCTQHNWPLNNVFYDILRNGCHLMPVGINIVDYESELDWRLSFSQAEQKLVYSMNHTQFLCYGLLKIFLKEVVNRDTEEPFLCSYFVKTAMFWLIQIGHITWCPNNLLDCFWKCFKYLLDCVHREAIPNFFIPQNNMFLSKLSTVRGARKRDCLLQQLNGYYEMGVTCLLESPTVRTMIEPVLCNRVVRIDPLMGHIKNVADTDVCIRKEIFERVYPIENIGISFLYLKTIYILLQSTHSLNQKLKLQKCTADVLVETAFLYLNNSTDNTNKKAYRSDRLIGNLLKLAGRMGDVSCMLYLAMYYYRTCRYREALHVTALVRSRLTQPYILYDTVDREIYTKSVSDWSLSKRMKRAWVFDVRLHHNFCFIHELALEQNVSKENKLPAMYISPHVVTDMLCVLCNYRLGNRSQCIQSLTDLQTMLLYADERYTPLYNRDIAWQILGICQHVVGDLHGALQSYQQSLRQEPFHKIQDAAKYRISLVLIKTISET